MRRPPSHEDKQLNDGNSIAAHPRKQNKMRPAQENQDSDLIYNDEHPEIPLTQRASRYLDDTLDSPLSQKTGNKKGTRARAYINPPHHHHPLSKRPRQDNPEQTAS